MADDSVTLRATQAMKPQVYCVTSDIIVYRKDGSFAIVPKGTLIEVPVPDGPMTFSTNPSSAQS